MRRSSSNTSPRIAERSHNLDSSPIAASAQADPVFLSMRIHTTGLTSVRRCLHDCIGKDFALYVAKVDYSSGMTLLQLRAERSRVDAVMSAVMRRLPEAEFGAVRTAQVQ